MSISDEDLALAMYRYAVQTRDDAKLHAGNSEKWLRAAAKARELLTPDMQMPEPESFTGPLRPGDVVSVRGVVHELDPPHPYVNVMIDGYRGTGIGAGMLWLDTEHVTFIERPVPPEPDWQPGDVAKSDGPKGDGTLYRYWPENGGHAPWLSLHRAAHVRWVSREKIPGTLTPCDVVPRKVK